MDQPLQSWLEMGLQGYALIFTMELNNQEVVLLVQNPTHLGEIITEGMRLGMEAYTQNQWYTTQTPLMLEHQPSTSTPALDIPHESDDLTCESNNEPSAFLPSTSHGEGVCSLVLTTQLFQSTVPLLESTQKT